MKHLLTYSSFFIFLFFLPSEGSSQTAGLRDVIFAHGQGGNGRAVDGDWERYDNIFTSERLMRGIRENWNERRGLANYGTLIADENFNIPAGATNRERPLGIGHSNGGLALRSMDVQLTGEAQILGAIATVGTPHHGGAVVANNLNGSIGRSLNRGCNALAAGPSTHVGFIPANFFSQQILCNAINSFITNPRLAGSVTDQSALDAAPGSEFLNSISGDGAANVPIVSVWGNEEGPVHWRLLSSLDSDLEDDMRFVHIANVALGAYLGASVYYGVRGSIGLIGGIFTLNPAAVAIGAYRVYQSVQYGRGAAWLSNSEQFWLDAIGCGATTISQTYTVNILPCQNFSPLSDEWMSCMESNGCFPPGSTAACSQQVTRTRTVTINGASDGFFCASTQIFDPFEPENIYEALGVNHSDETNTEFMQTLNDNDEIRRVLNLIFDRGDEFAVPTS